MHITSCENPKRIYNKYTQEFQYVPCGKCPTCLRSKASQWIERLNVERKCWKYCVFFTLTYSEENVPYLEKVGVDYVGDLTHVHQAPKEKSPLIQISELKCKQSKEACFALDLLLEQSKIPYLSVYDAQCFIKRLRKNLKTQIKAHYDTFTEKDYFVRYYLVGEYGSTTLRAHYHGLLFFSSEKEAACIEESIRKSWKFGIVDVQFTAHSNASYVAKYLNSGSYLSLLHKHKSICPFAIFSKSVPIGTLYFNEEKVREIFDNASPKMLVDYTKEISSVNVPLWRTYQDTLFPKLSCFGRFSHFDRVRLYRACVHFESQYPDRVNAADFASLMLLRNSTKHFGIDYLRLYDDYIEELKKYTKDLRASIIRWFSISKRVYTQSCCFDISIEDYVKQIELFVENCQKENLKIQYQFQQEYIDKFRSKQELIGIDKNFLETLLDVPLELMSAEEITILQNYGIDIEKFTSSDLSIRMEYQHTLLPENTRDYLNIVIDNGIWLKQHNKTKFKNDYLASQGFQNNFAKIHSLLKADIINSKF